MAGRGPAPKPAERRARGGGPSRDPFPTAVLNLQPAPQPKLPPKRPNGQLWPGQTRKWWRMWGENAQAPAFTAEDWSELLDTAVIHARLWGEGDVRVAAELRLRVAKFGATPEDRARLRITFAAADRADTPEKPVEESPARERYGDLKVAG